jgi:hypothetical protein
MSAAAWPRHPLPAVPTTHTASDDPFLHLLRTGSVVGLTDGRKIRECVASTLKKRLGSRQVISYRLALDDPQTGKQSVVELIGKKYSNRVGVRAASEFQAMRMLWEQGFGNDQRFKIPRPLQHFSEARLLLEERASGLPFSNYIGNNSRTSLRHARMAGLWLAKLHNLKSAPLGYCSYKPERCSLEIFLNQLCATQPSLALPVQEIGAVIRRELASFRAEPVAWVHGDFHPENILVGPGQITVIDFDRFGLADPAKDIGSFIAHMRTMACCSSKSLDAVNHEVQAFWNAYFSSVSPARVARLEERVAAFVAFSCLEALYYVACIMKVTEADLIARYLRCVQDSGPSNLNPGRLWKARHHQQRRLTGERAYCIRSSRAHVGVRRCRNIQREEFSRARGNEA